MIPGNEGITSLSALLFLHRNPYNTALYLELACSSRRGFDQHYPALPVSRDIKGEAATAAVISMASWFSGRLLKCVMKSAKEGNSLMRSSNGRAEPSGAVTK